MRWGCARRGGGDSRARARARSKKRLGRTVDFRQVFLSVSLSGAMALSLALVVAILAALLPGSDAGCTLGASPSCTSQGYVTTAAAYFNVVGSFYTSSYCPAIVGTSGPCFCTVRASLSLAALSALARSFSYHLPSCVAAERSGGEGRAGARQWVVPLCKRVQGTTARARSSPRAPSLGHRV